jgi:hypothetical protein
MNFRHAAALVLVGWYLMMPTSIKSSGVGLPLSQWRQLGAYDSAILCTIAQRLFQKQADSLPPDPPRTDAQDSTPSPPGYSASELQQVLANSVCIASDDPRLSMKVR